MFRELYGYLNGNQWCLKKRKRCFKEFGVEGKGISGIGNFFRKVMYQSKIIVFIVYYFMFGVQSND